MRMNMLDHGYLELVEHWGSDERIIEAARMSVDGGFVSWDAYEGHPKGDAGLLAYLWNHKHATPFEVPGMTVEVCCPVVVVWQWVRHRTMSYNILSGRYAEMPSDDYLPSVERCMVDAGKNKQAGAAKGAEQLTVIAAEAWLKNLTEVQAIVEKCYQDGLRAGIPKEIARLPLGFARYTRMRASANLRNWLAFLTLRMDSHAQWEIRAYANAVGKLVAEKFPRTWELFAREKS